MREQFGLAVLLLSVVVGPPSGDFQFWTHNVVGVVADSHGSLVAGAFVEAFPIGKAGNAGGIAGTVRWVRTGKDGEFRLTLRSRRYEIRAKDEKSRFSDPNFLLSSDPKARFPKIWVNDSDVSGVRVTLGSKGGIIEGVLRYEGTGQIISEGKVTISDARYPEAFVEVPVDKAGHFEFTVPRKPILIFATSPGYSTTYFGNKEEMTLTEGVHRSVILQLRPK
jgi:hypothetical protein